ncbi:MAG: HD domain-containing protein [Bacilli bacterium]|nr:HD domain-containing protein [Bacilli bacterium]
MIKNDKIKKEAKLFLIFDMLGDLKRSGAVQWKVKREKTEYVKDHVFDLIIITKLIKPYLPKFVDIDKIIDYAIVHDLEEAITGDITGFEGVSKEEKNRVNKIAMDYLIDTYGDILTLNKLFNEFENSETIEAKILHMLDKISSSIPFMKYDNEELIDMDNSEIIESLRTNPGVIKLKQQGLTLGEIFYVWHLKSVNISDDELNKYNISREDADMITNAIKNIMLAIHDEIPHLKEIEEDFPKEAMLYKNINN